MVKPGYIAAATPGRENTMVSNGKRMRILWTDGDGRGDSNKAFITGSKTTVRGHPTWKMYMGKVPHPIIYGRREPQGNIKANRPNRDRPAYLETSTTVFARGLLHDDKTAEYEFCGRPASSEQNTPDWRVRRPEEEAQAKRIKASTQISLSGTMPVLSMYESSIPRPYVSGPIDGNTKPLSITNKAIQGLPYFDIPTATIRKRPIAIPGDMAGVYADFSSKRNAEAALPTAGSAGTETTGMIAAPEPKRIKVKQEADIQSELLAMSEKLDSSE